MSNLGNWKYKIRQNDPQLKTHSIKAKRIIWFEDKYETMGFNYKIPSISAIWSRLFLKYQDKICSKNMHCQICGIISALIWIKKMALWRPRFAWWRRIGMESV
jgi:hypothetical protein